MYVVGPTSGDRISQPNECKCWATYLEHSSFIFLALILGKVSLLRGIVSNSKINNNKHEERSTISNKYTFGQDT